MSKRMWPRVTEDGVIYQAGMFAANVYRQARAIVVCGVRFVRERKCTITRTFHGSPCNEWECDECGKKSNSPKAPQYCPRCGARVTRVQDPDGCKLGKEGQRQEGPY